MKWKTKLKQWENGYLMKYPSKVKKRFFYETSPITPKMNTKYEHKFIESDRLEKLKPSHKKFQKHLINKRDIAHFANLPKTAILIVPVPRKHKNYATLKDFVDNASKSQQKKFWKCAAKSIKEMLKYHDVIWVSTHGLGVPYLHLRIEVEPKYYQTKKFTIP